MGGSDLPPVRDVKKAIYVVFMKYDLNTFPANISLLCSVSVYVETAANLAGFAGSYRYFLVNWHDRCTLRSDGVHMLLLLSLDTEAS